MDAALAFSEADSRRNDKLLKAGIAEQDSLVPQGFGKAFRQVIQVHLFGQLVFSLAQREDLLPMQALIAPFLAGAADLPLRQGGQEFLNVGNDKAVDPHGILGVLRFIDIHHDHLRSPREILVIRPGGYGRQPAPQHQ